jgi:O-acetyl-ADP-ribose deacetylase (regulator of RNase III)
MTSADRPDERGGGEGNYQGHAAKSEYRTRPWRLPARRLAHRVPVDDSTSKDIRREDIQMEQGWRSKIVLLKGDLTEAQVDAIVNAANNDLILGGGVAGAIRAKGGPSIQAECDKLGPIPIGEAVLTGAGKLRARYVIHAASMQLGGRTSEAALLNSTRNSLKRAAEQKLKSIAFPAIGTGIAGFPIERCAMVMLEEIRDHLRGMTMVERLEPVERVEIVLFDDRGLSVFQDALAKMVD